MDRATRGGPATRHAIRVRGTVQGVGFRPAVHRLARASNLGGFVKNDGDGVVIEIEGPADAVAGFPTALRGGAPPLARIDALEIEEAAPRGDRDFAVAASEGAGARRASIPADIATCEACVRELFDPRDRRHRYPFVCCAGCGPRFTIVRDLPYDRARTTMAVFEMCALCRAEYEDPTDRRFHAEPIACPACGPEVTLFVRGVRSARGAEAIARAIALLECGAIVAIKGLGGYQLAAIASDGAAVARLRMRKRRAHKPFALMARDLATAERLVELDDAAREALLAPSRPIVLSPAKTGAPVCPAVAPRVGLLGVMLPTTPLHHLLLEAGAGALVMTSGNVSDEPIAKDDADALVRLAGIADAFLVHDRAIHTRADDSVVRATSAGVVPIRRARGSAPDPVSLGFSSPSVLAVGAELKNAVCITCEGEAFLSQHIGDLGTLEARAFFEETIEKLGRLLGAMPEAVAHDLHPDYAATRWAAASGLRAIGVQHHHAHVVSCMVDAGVRGPAIGVAFDGTGCGPAGDAWGGEVLAFDLAGFERLGHLRPIALPGGEAAIREPWRLAVAALVDAGEPIDLVPDLRSQAVRSMLTRGVLSPRATGAGRWFDAVSAILGIRTEISYEAQAAAELEALAGDGDAAPYDFEIAGEAPFEIDLRPAIRAIAGDVRRGASKGDVASRFHATMAEVVLAGCRAARGSVGLETVALSGGCFQNARLAGRAIARLVADGFRVVTHRRVPPNDGGIALGQAAIAAHRIATERGAGI